MEAPQHLYLTITRIDGPLYVGEATSVTVPGTDGEMTVLAKHEPFISPLRQGVITVRCTDGSQESFEVERGTIEVSKNQATILV